METVANDCKHEDCKYRQYVSFLGECCLYLYFTGKMRRSDISECDKYSPGKIEVIHTLEGVIYKVIDYDV